MPFKTEHGALIGMLLLGSTACVRPGGDPTISTEANEGTTSAPTDPGTTPQGSAMMGPSQLTPEQQATVQKIYREDGQQVLRLRQQLMSKRYELNALMMSQNPDEKRTQALIKEISNLNEQTLQAEATMQQRFSQAGCPTCGTMAFGGGMGMMGDWSGMGMGPGMKGPNELTPEQQTKVQQIYRDDGQRIFGLRQQLMSKQYELNALVTSQNPDQKRIRSLTKDISSLNGQILEAEAIMRRRLSQAGVPPSWGYGMCPTCGMGMGHHGMMGGRQWHGCW